MDKMFDAKIKVLGEYIDHQAKEERNEIFSKARAARGSRARDRARTYGGTQGRVDGRADSCSLALCSYTPLVSRRLLLKA